MAATTGRWGDAHAQPRRDAARSSRRLLRVSRSGPAQPEPPRLRRSVHASLGRQPVPRLRRVRSMSRARTTFDAQRPAVFIFNHKRTCFNIFMAGRRASSDTSSPVSARKKQGRTRSGLRSASSWTRCSSTGPIPKGPSPHCNPSRMRSRAACRSSFRLRAHARSTGRAGVVQEGAIPDRDGGQGPDRPDRDPQRRRHCAAQHDGDAPLEDRREEVCRPISTSDWTVTTSSERIAEVRQQLVNTLTNW